MLDSDYMNRAMILASNGLGNVSPNPLVGCVIVYNDQIIGEGWHQKFGASHAEIMAIEQVGNKSQLKDATLYVNLEPCAHHGKTPPCAVRIIEEQIGRVVISIEDPNPLVAGKGIAMMKSKGINVEVGCLADKGKKINRRFLTFIEKKRPYIILKWAETADQFIAKPNFESKWISDQHSRKIVHKWRSEEDGILVGTNTANYDNPGLNVRDWEGRNPVRIVIDKQLRLASNLNIFDLSQPTLCYNLEINKTEDNLEFVKLNAENFIEALLADLAGRNIISLIVEGGSKLINYFIQTGQWDEARVFKSRAKFTEGIDAPGISEDYLISKDTLVNDELFIFVKP